MLIAGWKGSKVSCDKYEKNVHRTYTEGSEKKPEAHKRILLCKTTVSWQKLLGVGQESKFGLSESHSSKT